MKSYKKLALIVATCVVCSSAFALVACNNDSSTTGSKPSGNQPSQGGTPPQIECTSHIDSDDDGLCDNCKYVTDNLKGKLLGFSLQDDGRYFYSEGGYALTSVSETTEGELIIPTTYKNKNILNIGNLRAGFTLSKNCPNVTTVIIPNSINNIATCSFSGFKNIQSITIPFIGESKTGKGLTNFGQLFGTYTANSFNDNVPASLKTVIVTGGINVAEGAFSKCSNITTIQLPDTITTFSRDAFNGCTALRQINLPKNLTSIGAYAFSKCSNLNNVTIPKRVTDIKSYAFKDCTSLTEINYEGTSAEWAQVTKAEGAIPSTVTVNCLGDNA